MRVVLTGQCNDSKGIRDSPNKIWSPKLADNSPSLTLMFFIAKSVMFFTFELDSLEESTKSLTASSNA